MPNPICPEHQLEAKVQSGIRNKRTGRLYPPFYGCPWTGEDEFGARVYCKHRFDEKPTAQSLATGIQTMATSTVKDKDSQIRFMNALKVSSELIAAQIIPIAPDVDPIDELQRVADVVYSLKPPTSDGGA